MTMPKTIISTRQIPDAETIRGVFNRSVIQSMVISRRDTA
jgi:hypothetical protein